MIRLSRLLSEMFPRLPSSASSILAALLATAPVVGHATMLEVSINTTAYNGTDGVLAFDFLDGDGLVNNSVFVSDFYTDGTLGIATSLGSARGSLVSPDSLTLTDEDFPTSRSQAIRFGTSISFLLELTEQPSTGIFPDSFAVFLFNDSGNSLFSTTDFIGANALFAIDINGSAAGDLYVFAATDPDLNVSWTVQAPSAVPIPGTAWLLGSALLGGLAARRRRLG